MKDDMVVSYAMMIGNCDRYMKEKERQEPIRMANINKNNMDEWLEKIWKPLNKHCKDEIIDKTRKETTYYHDFDFEGRVITLCVLTSVGITNTIWTGYSVKLPQDTHNRELSKKISKGRAQMKTSLTANYEYTMSNRLAVNKTALKAVAEDVERRIRKGELKIKGIR